ncbi:NUDIX hydrolase [Radiobacillus deserti]|uniref:NUDIX hydrolase n=1 Tax=Radiobacillus deserti TaxID=2594883 RepID=UPI002B220D71|nr:NUDIX domain-containing protein [Radiobacillus deserti]
MRAHVEDGEGRILLQKRKDYGEWGIPGGILEIGEAVEDTVRREVLEETNLTIRNVQLFGIYSGERGFAEYENGDKVYSVQIIFYVKECSGSLKANEESHELTFFAKDELPSHINPHQAEFINDWRDNRAIPIIK